MEDRFATNKTTHVEEGNTMQTQIEFCHKGRGVFTKSDSLDSLKENGPWPLQLTADGAHWADIPPAMEYTSEEDSSRRSSLRSMDGLGLSGSLDFDPQITSDSDKDESTSDESTVRNTSGEIIDEPAQNQNGFKKRRNSKVLSNDVEKVRKEGTEDLNGRVVQTDDQRENRDLVPPTIESGPVVSCGRGPQTRRRCPPGFELVQLQGRETTRIAQADALPKQRPPPPTSPPPSQEDDQRESEDPVDPELLKEQWYKDNTTETPMPDGHRPMCAKIVCGEWKSQGGDDMADIINIDIIDEQIMGTLQSSGEMILFKMVGSKIKMIRMNDGEIFNGEITPKVGQDGKLGSGKVGVMCFEDDRVSGGTYEWFRKNQCHLCKTCCNSVGQLYQHINSGGCHQRRCGLCQVPCLTTQSIFVGGIPMGSSKDDVLDAIRECGLKLDDKGFLLDDTTTIIQMEEGTDCQWAVVQLVSTEEQKKAITIGNEMKMNIEGTVLSVKGYNNKKVYKEEKVHKPEKIVVRNQPEAQPQTTMVTHVTAIGPYPQTNYVAQPQPQLQQHVMQTQPQMQNGAYRVGDNYQVCAELWDVVGNHLPVASSCQILEGGKGCIRVRRCWLDYYGGQWSQEHTLVEYDADRSLRLVYQA